MSRFRPNIVIGNTSRPFDKDGWKAIRIGDSKDAAVTEHFEGMPPLQAIVH